MGIEHLSQAHPDANFIVKALIAFVVFSFINFSISSSGDQENYDFVFEGKHHSVVVEKGEDPVFEAQFLVNILEELKGKYPPNVTQISKSDITKRSKFDLFWRFEGFLVIMGIVWIILRYLNRLAYGEDHHTNDDW